MNRRERETWLKQLPVEERVRILFGDPDDPKDDRPIVEAADAVLTGPHRRLVGDDCYVAGCDRLSSAGLLRRGFTKRRSGGRLCSGHRKQQERGQPFRPLIPRGVCRRTINDWPDSRGFPLEKPPNAEPVVQPDPKRPEARSGAPRPLPEEVEHMMDYKVMAENFLKTRSATVDEDFLTDLKRLIEEVYTEGYEEGWTSGYYSGRGA